MCSIIVINHHYRDFPLVIASNRDEDIGRPSSNVQLLSTDPLIMGGRDDLKGGTWLAVNGHSLFAGITNQGTTNPDLETRGKIVMEALKSSSLNDLIQFVENIDPSHYNGFNLVFGNQQKVFLAQSYILHSVVIKELTNGIHTISNDMVFNTTPRRSQYIHSKLDTIKDKPWLEYYKLLKTTLANREYGVRLKPKKDATYCTRSSSILAFSGDGLARYKFYDRTAAKPEQKPDEPLTPKYKDYIDIFRQSSNEKQVSEESGDDEDEDKEEGIKPVKPIQFSVSTTSTTGNIFFPTYTSGQWDT